MRRTALLGCMILAVGCGPAQDQEVPAAEMSEAPAAEMSAADAPAATPLADFAGTWSMRALTEAGDSVLVEYEMEATSTTEGSGDDGSGSAGGGFVVQAASSRGNAHPIHRPRSTMCRSRSPRCR